MGHMVKIISVSVSQLMYFLHFLQLARDYTVWDTVIERRSAKFMSGDAGRHTAGKKDKSTPIIHIYP